MPKIEYKRYDSNRCFGVELEVSNNFNKCDLKRVIKDNSLRKIRVSGWAQSNNNDYWHIKDDSTCGPLGESGEHGWEVASFKAKGIDDLLHIGEVADALYESGVQVNDHCGLHIHADVSLFSPKRVATLLARWIKIESILEQMVPFRRRRNYHCRFWMRDYRVKEYVYRISSNESIWGSQSFWEAMRPTNLGIHQNDQKRVTLNLVNYALAESTGNNRRKTVELRLPEGTLNGNDIVNWVRFFLNFVDESETASFPKNLNPIFSLEDFFQILGLSHRSKFYILSEGMNCTKSWILDRIMEYGTNGAAAKASEKWCKINIPWQKIPV